MLGEVFDIQRYSLHDGPGIRTTVFLKGCPFSCVWCSNPESIDPKPQLAFDIEKCNNCLQCTSFCKTAALTILDGKLKVNFEKCKTCGDCVSECPQNALQIYGYQLSSDEVISIVLKDIAYFNNSGGGLTLSGGDPLFQFAFTKEILQKAKVIGINTCVETEGIGSQKQFEELLPLVDYFYFDYKLTDPCMHLQFTGVSNEAIINNLKFLAVNNANIVLRCIVIPGINDNNQHLESVATLSKQLNAIREVHIMPYHQYGKSKYRKIGRSEYPIQSGNVPEEKAKDWVKRVQQYGGINIKIG